MTFCKKFNAGIIIFISLFLIVLAFCANKGIVYGYGCPLEYNETEKMWFYISPLLDPPNICPSGYSGSANGANQTEYAQCNPFIGSLWDSDYCFPSIFDNSVEGTYSCNYTQYLTTTCKNEETGDTLTGSCAVCRHIRVIFDKNLCGTYEYNGKTYILPYLRLWHTDGECTMTPPTFPDCAIEDVSVPPTCTLGQNFNISYKYRNLKPSIYPYLSQRVEWYNQSGSWANLWCQQDEAVNDTEWRTTNISVPCQKGSDGKMRIRIGIHQHYHAYSPLGINWCHYNWEEAQMSCTAGAYIINPIPPAIGYVKIKHPLGILKLRLIAVVDALSALKGVIKVARFAGDKNAAADLVEVNDPNASPVRVRTPYGIKAWRKEP